MSHVSYLARDGSTFNFVECGVCDLICKYGPNDILQQFGMVRTRQYWAVQWDDDNNWRWTYCPQCDMGSGFSLDTGHGSCKRRISTSPLDPPERTRLTNEIKRLNEVLDLYEGVLFRYVDADDVEHLIKTRKAQCI